MLSRVDRGELLAALHDGAEEPPFARFLDRLRRRLGAAFVAIVEREEGAAPRRWHLGDAVIAARWSAIDRLGGMRPDRVYPLADLDPTDPDDGRVVRTASRLGQHWLMAIGRPDGFVAADAALLSELSDHLALACANRWRAGRLHRDLAAANAALARGGIGWALLDGDGGMLAGGPVPAAQRERAALGRAIAAGAAVAAAGGVVATPIKGQVPAALATFRLPAAPIDRAAVFAATHGVPRREARLAVALAEHGSLAAAARALDLTPDSARFYAKRLYQTLELQGQADLVRLVLTGPAMLG